MPYENGQLTPEELEPTPEDHALGAQLVAEGWKSVSNKYRTIRRWTEQPPSSDDMRAVLVERFGKWAPHYVSTPCLRIPPPNTTEERTLTVRQYRAFRLAGGESA